MVAARDEPRRVCPHLLPPATSLHMDEGAPGAAGVRRGDVVGRDPRHPSFTSCSWAGSSQARHCRPAFWTPQNGLHSLFAIVAILVVALNVAAVWGLDPREVDDDELPERTSRWRAVREVAAIGAARRFFVFTLVATALLLLQQAVLESGLVGTCGIIELEIRYSARSHKDHVDIRRDRTRGYEWFPMPDEVWSRALDVQHALSERALLRALKFPDLVIACTAERHGLIVMHYDHD